MEPRFGLPEIATNQDNILPHNDALKILAILAQTAVEDKDLTAPPGAPTDGKIWIVGAGATGAWATHDRALAYYRSAGWTFFPASGSPTASHKGIAAYVKDESLAYRIDGSGNWAPESGSGTGGTVTVRAATTTNITIATALNAGDTIDGVTLAADDLVLVKSQTAPAENGIYVVGASPARAAAFDSYDEHAGALISVQEGTVNADTLWLCTSNKGGTLNTTAINFAASSGGGAEASVSDFRGNVADKVLTTDVVWSAADYVALTDVATIAVDLATGINFTVTLGANRSLGNPTNTKNGQTGLIEIKQDGTGSRTLSYSSSWKFAGGSAPTLTTAANARDLLFYQVISSSVIYAALVADVK